MPNEVFPVKKVKLNPSNAYCVNLNIEEEEDSNFHGKQKRLFFISWPIFNIVKSSGIKLF